jgi:hypothetical protein
MDLAGLWPPGTPARVIRDPEMLSRPTLEKRYEAGPFQKASNAMPPHEPPPSVRPSAITRSPPCNYRRPGRPASVRAKNSRFGI